MLEDLIYRKVLPLQQFYKVDAKETGKAPLRNGEIKDTYILENTCINSVMGETKFIPVIEIYLRYGSMHGSLDIYINEYETHKFVKQFTVRSQPNNIDIKDLQKIYNDISNIITNSENEACVKIVEYLTDKNNKLIFEIYG